MRRLLCVVVLLLSLVGCVPGAKGPPEGRVDIGTHSLYIHCLGEGSPTVVIDVGVGESYTSWEPLQQELAQTNRVCAYDRAGYGQSDPGPMPRHSAQVAAELRQLLETAGVDGPHVLVGHSLGGLNMQVFASRYPDTLAGLVLLDPPPLGWITGEAPFSELRELFRSQAGELRSAGEAARRSTEPELRAQADLYETLASEHEAMLGETAAQVAAIDSFRDMPLVVMAAGRANPAFGTAAEPFQQYWIEQNRALASKSSRGRFVLVAESGHQLHIDAPDRVLEAVRGMLK